MARTSLFKSATPPPDFIDVAYLESAWRTLNADETVRATTIIHQVSQYLRQIARNNDVDIDAKIARDPIGVYGDNVKMVVANAVQRAMARPLEMSPDATSFTQSASPYSETMMFSSGDASQTAYFKKKELQLLGFASISGKGGTTLLRGARGNGED